MTNVALILSTPIGQIIFYIILYILFFARVGESVTACIPWHVMLHLSVFVTYLKSRA